VPQFSVVSCNRAEDKGCIACGILLGCSTLGVWISGSCNSGLSSDIEERVDKGMECHWIKRKDRQGLKELDWCPGRRLGVTAGRGGTLERYLVPLVLVRQSQGPSLCANAGLWYWQNW
jgi:hypothetical protein